MSSRNDLSSVLWAPAMRQRSRSLTPFRLAQAQLQGIRDGSRWKEKLLSCGGYQMGQERKEICNGDENILLTTTSLPSQSPRNRRLRRTREPAFAAGPAGWPEGLRHPPSP